MLQSTQKWFPLSQPECPGNITTIKHMCFALCAKNIGPQANCKLVSRTWVWFKLQGTTENVDTSVKKLLPRSVSNDLSQFTVPVGFPGVFSSHNPKQHNRTHLDVALQVRQRTQLVREGHLHPVADGFAQKVTWIFVCPICSAMCQFAWGFLVSF